MKIKAGSALPTSSNQWQKRSPTTTLVKRFQKSFCRKESRSSRNGGTMMDVRANRQCSQNLAPRPQVLWIVLSPLPPLLSVASERNFLNHCSQPQNFKENQRPKRKSQKHQRGPTQLAQKAALLVQYKNSLNQILSMKRRGHFWYRALLWQCKLLGFVGITHSGKNSTNTSHLSHRLHLLQTRYLSSSYVHSFQTCSEVTILYSLSK